MIQKSDWKTLEMPPRTASFTLSYPLADSDLAAIREGHRPEEMEDKWFMYCEGDTLYIHRSWTGYCIYAVALSQTGSLAGTPPSTRRPLSRRTGTWWNSSSTASPAGTAGAPR